MRSSRVTEICFIVLRDGSRYSSDEWHDHFPGVAPEDEPSFSHFETGDNVPLCSAQYSNKRYRYRAICMRIVKTPGQRCYRHEEPLVRVVKRAMRMK